MRKFFLGLALSCCLCWPAGPARADLQESLLNEYSASEKGDTYSITDSTVRNIDEVLSNPNIRIICWQVEYKNYDEAWTPRLLEWVRNGGSLWFYDARLADRFGMEMYELRGDQFRGNPEKGDIGDVKMKGRAVTVFPIQNHAVSTGVGSVAAFLPVLDEKRDVYGSIVPHEGTLNLLQFAADSPALAALRREGYGTVVFKPLLWEKSLSGERFQRNLIDYCAGYGVPGMGGEGRVGEQLQQKQNYVKDTAYRGSSASEMTGNAAQEPAAASGSQGGTGSALDSTIAEARSLYNADSQAKSASNEPPAAVSQDSMKVAGEQSPRLGRVITKEIVFEGGSESFRLSPAEMRSLVMGQHGNLDTLELRSGRIIKGFMTTTSVSIETKDGVYDCPKSSLQSITFGDNQEQ
ncbi:MAG: hypothetical protein Q4F00_07780 [bacterium]|nr:hypothetical protein [bacterium]